MSPFCMSWWSPMRLCDRRAAALAARRPEHRGGRSRNVGAQQAVAQSSNLVVEPCQVRFNPLRSSRRRVPLRYLVLEVQTLISRPCQSRDNPRQLLVYPTLLCHGGHFRCLECACLKYPAKATPVVLGIFRDATWRKRLNSPSPPKMFETSQRTRCSLSSPSFGSQATVVT